MKRVPLLLGLCLVLMLSGCAIPVDDITPTVESTPQVSETPDPSMPSFNSPREFAGEPRVITLEAVNSNLAGDFASRFILVGERAYGLTADSIGAVDLATGETIWETRFPDGNPNMGGFFFDSSQDYKPVINADGSTVFAALQVTIPGHGTTSGFSAIQLMAVDARTGHIDWSTNIPAQKDANSSECEHPRVAHQDNTRIIVTCSNFWDDRIIAVDPASQDVLWEQAGRVVAVTSDVIVATAPHESGYWQLTGFSLSTGARLWMDADDEDSAVNNASAVEIGAGLLVSISARYESRYSVVINPATGEVIRHLPDVFLTNPVVSGDIVYSLLKGYDHEVRALSTSDFSVLWELPTENEDRFAPRNPIVFSGLVYGGGMRINGDLTSVILDGKTGEDIAWDIPGTFIEVNQYGAIMLVPTDTHTIAAFVPATG